MKSEGTMEILGTKQASFVVDDDLLNFTLEGGDGDEAAAELAVSKSKGGASSSSSPLKSSKSATQPFRRGTQAASCPESMEEELEWLSNKDAFPAVETCFGILSDNPDLVSNLQSPVSVLESSSQTTNSANSSITIATCCNSIRIPANHPVRTRSTRRRRTSGFDILLHRLAFPARYRGKHVRSRRGLSHMVAAGRRCLHCQADKTPQWRTGPMGPKTLCNACGVRYKSGRLLPEYRPASSPTFSIRLHSNSHRKVVEMRKQKQMAVVVAEDIGAMVNVPVAVASCGYKVE